MAMKDRGAVGDLWKTFLEPLQSAERAELLPAIDLNTVAKSRRVGRKDTAPEPRRVRARATHALCSFWEDILEAAA